MVQKYIRSALGALLLVLSLVSTEGGKSISKNPHSKVDKAKLQMMQNYVPAQAANGDDLSSPVEDPITGTITVCQTGALIDGACLVHPLVTVYMEEETDNNEETGFDIHTAVSLDEGGTWKRKNLSSRGQKVREYQGRKCFTANGSDDGDHSHRLLHEGEEGDEPISFLYVVNAFKPMLVVKGNKALVAWTSKECHGGYQALGEDDKYMVDGSQFCHDYAGEKEGLGVVPFSCVWAARGIMDPYGTMTWTKNEQLTTGRRDAFQLFAAVSGDGKVWGLVWQEDPKGLRPGEAAGPGEGMSGSTVSHKTDIWYSYLGGGDFAKTEVLSEEENPSNRPVPEVRFTSPVRVTDNGSCKIDPDGNVYGGTYCEDICNAAGGTSEELLDPQGYYICVKDGVPLDGKKGSSRPTMVILPTKDDALGVPAGWQVLIVYEKSKGMGLDGEKEVEREDWGKNVFFHSFPYNDPDVVSPGTQLNLPELDEFGEPIMTESGAIAYHNARRGRIIAQPTKNMGDASLAAYLIWREGAEGHGQPAHIMGRRLLGGHLPSNLECKETREVNTNRGPQQVCIKGVEDLNKDQLPEAEGNLTDARAHRGFVRGDFLAVLYTFTEKWGRGEGKPYDVYLRRSFNGGKKWTAYDTGVEEAPKNLSNLRPGEPGESGSGGWSAMEPRLVGTPGTIGGTSPKTPSDVQNDMVFYVAYCTTHNPHSGSAGRMLEEGMPTEKDVAKDILVTWTDNYGETFKKIYNSKVDKWQYPWIAKTSGSSLPDDPQESYGAPQVKVTPGGDKMFASYEGNVLPIPEVRMLQVGSAGPCNGGNGGSDVCLNNTRFNPFKNYDSDGDDAVTTNDLRHWKQCCSGANTGMPRNCDGVVCDLDGDGRRTGHDKKLLETSIAKYYKAHPAQRRRLLRGGGN